MRTFSRSRFPPPTRLNYDKFILRLPPHKFWLSSRRTASCKMAEGVLPFVRGLDLTRNDFKVAFSFCFNFSIENFNL